MTPEQRSDLILAISDAVEKAMIVMVAMADHPKPSQWDDAALLKAAALLHLPTGEVNQGAPVGCPGWADNIRGTC